jgi:UDP-N-acetylglucosamine--dolichyl-phosphate N-acetylglucosaminephosphotransferase
MAVLLGFADDVIDLKWRHKLIVPTIATLPLLVAYNGVTNVIMPKFIRPLVGPFVNLGIIYHIYMGSLAVFCTNSINIYAGINGIEAGQSFIIACFIFIHNIIVSSLFSNLNRRKSTLELAQRSSRIISFL